MGQPLVSVVVPTFSRPALLEEALRSVREQTMPDFECLVVDDHGSPPAEVPADDRFRLLRTAKNSGCAAARNVGLDSARGTYVAFLDDDDRYATERLAIGLAAARHQGGSLCARGDWSGNRRGRGQATGRLADSILDGYSPSLGQVTVLRDGVPYFDESFPACEDVDWFLRLAHERGIACDPYVGYLVRSHDEIRISHGEQARLSGSHLLLDKHHEYFSSHPRAAAFRWERIARLSVAVGRPDREVRQAIRRSIAARPTRTNVMLSMQLVLRVGAGAPG